MTSLLNDRGLDRGVSAGCALWLFLLWATPVQIAMAQAGDEKSREPIEEITAYGNRSMLSFRLEMEAAEEKYYDYFNDLNDDEEFDITCKIATLPASHIKARMCKGNFEWSSLDDAARERMERGNLTNLLPIQNHAEIERKKRLTLDKMEKLANENPDFREALFALTRISRKFEAERKKRCAGRIICRNGDESSGE
jgi:hypothetical protein